MLFDEKLDPRFNVKIAIYDGGNLVGHRISHNVMTNTGRAWLSKIVGASGYEETFPTPHRQEKIQYMGFGCGGALQTDTRFSRTQTELVTVFAIEDPVPFSVNANSPSEKTYLKQVDPQLDNTLYFPGDYRTRFIVDVAETEISFAASVTAKSNVTVGTHVPISEAGLYLSSAKPNFTTGSTVASEQDPTGANEMVAYNIFDPIVVTPNVTLRIEWELRF